MYPRGKYLTGPGPWHTQIFPTLQDSRPHVLFGTVLVKHLLDFISSFPRPVQFLRFDFGDSHRRRPIRIQSGGNQQVCNFQDVLKLFFKRLLRSAFIGVSPLSSIVEAPADSDQVRLFFCHCQCADSLLELV
jgi:hypothetical protein